MRDVSLTVAGIVADGFEGSTPELTRGEVTTFDLGFWSHADVGGGVYGESLYGEGIYGGTTFAGRYRALREYLEFATPKHVRTGSEGNVWYRERVPEAAPIDSFVVDIDPGEDVIDFDGIWGVVVGGSDPSRPVSKDAGLRRLSLDVYVLAELNEYEDREDVEDAFGSPVI